MTKQQSFLLLAVLIIVGGGAGYYFTQKGSSAPTATTTTQPVAKSYTADVPYIVPGDKTETVHLTATLEGGVISDLKFTTNTPDNPASKENIDAFTQAFAAMSFKGKKLSEVSIAHLGGASLTSNAFMKAIGQISAQANNG